MKRIMKFASFYAATVSAVALCAGSAALGAAPVRGPGPGDWYNVGGDAGGSKFSALTQITPANVGQLQKAWSYDTGDRAGGFRGWEVTPIVVGDIMYFPTSSSSITALNG